MFSKFFSTKLLAFTKSVVEFHTLPDSFADAAAAAQKKTGGPNLPSGSELFCPDAATGPSSPSPLKLGSFVRVSRWSIRAKMSVFPAKDDLRATEFCSDLCPMGPPESAIAYLSVPIRSFSAVTKRVMTFDVTIKLRCNR